MEPGMNILAAEIPDAAIAGIVGLGTIVFVGLASWALLMLVKLSGVVAALEAEYRERSADHERRISWLEARPFGGG